MNQFSDCVIAIGFEPMTVCLEGRCSIQLSYATLKTLTNQLFTKGYAERLGFEPRQHFRVDRLAICSITTLAPLLWITKSDAKIHYQPKIDNLFDSSIAALIKVIVLAFVVFNDCKYNQCNTYRPINDKSHLFQFNSRSIGQHFRGPLRHY